ncbi:hypothetical protein BDU57DRAFT_173851 [Ampelomyces quisqualis]|uniref:Uncharacterized protein n=1 Tax=Ampelomyces quisqualis TaxID=50730 RepID=A0A6A5QPN0_AMPQU|nr:hypothetical protein BDU57DRAFT_173851 [Ampelomyces quisqualis]
MSSGYPKPPMPVPPKELPSPTRPEGDLETDGNDSKPPISAQPKRPTSPPWPEDALLFDGNNFMKFLKKCYSGFDNTRASSLVPLVEDPDNQGSLTPDFDKTFDSEMSRSQIEIERLMSYLDLCALEYEKMESPSEEPPEQAPDEKGPLTSRDDKELTDDVSSSDLESLKTFLKSEEAMDRLTPLQNEKPVESHRTRWSWGFNESDPRLNNIPHDFDPVRYPTTVK